MGEIQVLVLGNFWNFFFSNTCDPWLIESADVDPRDKEG